MDTKRDLKDPSSLRYKRGNYNKEVSKTHVNVLSSEHIYYSMTLSNNNVGSEQLPTNVIQAKYQENRQSPLLQNGIRYKMAVVKASIPASIIKKNTFENDYHTFRLVYPDNPAIFGQASANMTTGSFNSTTNFATRDGSTTPDNQLSVYTYQQTLDAFNKALQDAFAALITSYDGTFGAGSYIANVNLPQTVPYIIYDTTTDRFSFYFDPNYASDRADNQRIDLYFKYATYRLFEGLYGKLFSYGTSATNQDFKVIVRNYIGTNSITTGGNNYLVMTQETRSSLLWHDLRKIVLVSNTLNIRQEMYSYSTLNENSDGLNKAFSAITDFDYSISETNDGVYSDIDYAPSFYRWIDILNDLPLTKMDLQAYYLDIAGNLNPIYIAPDSQFEVTLIFKKVD